MLKYKTQKNFLTNILLFLLLNLNLLLNFSCNTTEPTDDIKPGRRDYTWTVDTLNIPFTVLTRIWGSSNTDVWAIGPGGDADKTIYHFDGVSWSNDGISRPLSPTTIFGFSISNVWICGLGGDIWNYNGIDYIKKTTVTIPNYNFVGFEDIWGDSENNIYAVGFAQDGTTYRSVIVKYDGISWKNLEAFEMRNSFIKIRRGQTTSNDFYILGVGDEPFAEDTSFIYSFSTLKLIQIYKGLRNVNEIAGIENINDEIFFLKGNKLFKYVNNNFQFFLDVGEPAAFFGRSRKDIFLGKLNGISHYNGSDIQYLYQFNDPGIRIFMGIVFEKEVFFLAYDVNKSLNLIIRGKLEE